MKAIAPISTLATILKARDAELSADYPALRAALDPFWPDILLRPSVGDLDTSEQAEILRFAGLYLNKGGWGDGMAGCQALAKNLLSESADLFDELNETDKAVSARILLANCYWLAGETREFEDILAFVSHSCGSDRGPAVRIQLNQIAALNDQERHTEAYEILRRVRKQVTPDLPANLTVQFHNIAGITLMAIGESEKSYYHLSLGAEIAQSAGLKDYLGMMLGELAMWHLNARDYAAAHDLADQSLNILPQGSGAHAYDTHALIYIEERRYAEAAEAADKAISILSKTDDGNGLMAALFTKCRCLIYQEEYSLAVETYGRLSRVAEDLGGHASPKYARLFCEALGLSKTKIDAVLVNRFECNFHYTGKPLFFCIARPLMRSLGVNAPSVVFVNSVYKPVNGLKILIYGNEGLEIANLICDDLCTVIQRQDGEFVVPESTEVVGAILGYCPLVEAQGVVRFKKF